jgi:hypothetical protein
VKCYHKPILLFVMIFIFITMSVGCNGSNPIIPGIIDPNPTVNPDNSTVSYVKVSASSSTIKINQSLQFVVKGYNSDDEWVILDKSKIKLWDWHVIGQCYNCVVEFIDLSPQSGSLTTTFSSGVTGTFYIVAYYQENPGDEYITDYTEVKVTN